MAALSTSRSAGRAARARPVKRGPAQPGFNSGESPLTWLSRRKGADGRPMIAETQLAAGERLRADFTLGHMGPRVTTNWSEAIGGRRGRSGPGAGLEISERATAARERVRRALAAVGPELSGILIDICCHLKRLEDTERAHGWPQRSAKLVLQLALAGLARHYGLDRSPRSRGAAADVRHWGAPDYRPSAADVSS